MTGPSSPLRQARRGPGPSSYNMHNSPDASSGSGSGSGVGSGSSSRKRVREYTAMANGNAAEAMMRDGGPDEDEEYFDVDMDTQDAYDQMEATRERSNDQNVQQQEGLFVPYYSHLGGTDFDQEDLN